MSSGNLSSATLAEIARYVGVPNDAAQRLVGVLALVGADIARVATLEAENARLRDAVRWALGEHEDDFPSREPGQGAYYWRTELRRRAGAGEVAR